MNSTSIATPLRKSLLNLTSKKALNFFLKAENYCSLELPPYFVFNDLINEVHNVLKNKALSDLGTPKNRNHEHNNYTILNNKDGKYSWRPFQLIHPALYVSLIHQITDESNWKLLRSRFKKFAQNKKIRCLSLPVVSLSEKKDKAEQIVQWWQEVEQKSIELSLDYEYLIETDITDCYSSIYTHSIAWALHTRKTAKEQRNNKALLGNIIDKHIQNMRDGQTNGIPQGSVLMDFIAEIVLGYADIKLSEKISDESITDYCILRYRDDYRIFVNNPRDGEKIVKLLTETMIDLGLKLSPSKTKTSNNVVLASIKSDKLAWLGREKWATSFQKRMLIIHEHSIQHPNSGSLFVALLRYYQKLSKIQKNINHIAALISIVVDIAYRNPRTYAVSAAIISKLLNNMENEDEKLFIIKKIKNKFSQIPNTEYMHIWLQRVTLPFSNPVFYDTPLCKLVSGENEKIWNTDWISSPPLKKAINASKIIDKNIIANLEPIISHKEIETFANYSSY